jgi:trigger factor
MNAHMDEKYEEIKKTVNLKGFRPGKVPKEILKRQFGQAIFSEVLDKVLKDTSVKALEDNKIKPAGQPKLDLKTYGEDKDLEYIMSVTELPKVELKSLEKIKFDEYSVKIDENETDKRIEEIAKSQNNFVDVADDDKAADSNSVTFDYKATIDGKYFTGGEGKNTQLILGKDLFIKGFDKQLIGVKKNDEKLVEAVLPENYPQKEFAKKKANFVCKIIAVKRSEDIKAVDGNSVVFDYKATIDGKNFTGGEGKNTQLILGKDLFIKGFDKQLIGVKKNDEKLVEAILPENYPQKEFANKKANFVCKIIAVKKSEDVKIDDIFAKNLGAKDLTDLKLLISKQINDEYKNSLDKIAKNQILKEIENFKIDEIPNNLVEEEVKILAQGMSEEDAKKSRKNFENVAKKRIKVGLILNEFGEQNKVKVTEQEIQSEVQKQLRMMPGQEKMVMEFYQKNPSALASLRGTVYEEKIIDLIKTMAKPNKKEITKKEAEKILKEHQKQEHGHKQDHDHNEEKKASTKKDVAKPKSKKSTKTKVKKVSKK